MEHRMFENKIELANLPTKIEKLHRTSEQLGKNIYIKRDDQTGTELSGNKIRKLEYSIQEALDQKADTLITCGGLQSNHCRATAAAALKVGLHCILVLGTDEKTADDGNLLLDKLLGSEIVYISMRDYAENRPDIMQKIANDLSVQGRKGYLIPVGASNGIGTFGYYNAIKEIEHQEKEMDIRFDTMVCTVGSGGTYAGLCLGNKINNLGKKIIGFNISANADYFVDTIQSISKEFYSYLDRQDALSKEDLHIIDGNVGRGYALNTSEELAFIHNFAKQEGIILDPVYTGKAMRGLYKELEQKNRIFEDSKNILFIHTGGLFGLFPKRFQFDI